MVEYDEMRQPQYATEKADRAPNVTEELASLVRRLYETIEYAETKLANVLSPEYGGGNPSTADNTPTPLTSPIKDVQNNLATAVGRLRLLLDRVEA